MAKGKIFLIAPKENPFLFFYISKKYTCIIRFLNGSNNTLVILLDFFVIDQLLWELFQLSAQLEALWNDVTRNENTEELY